MALAANSEPSSATTTMPTRFGTRVPVGLCRHGRARSLITDGARVHRRGGAGRLGAGDEDRSATLDSQAVAGSNLRHRSLLLGQSEPLGEAPEPLVGARQVFGEIAEDPALRARQTATVGLFKHPEPRCRPASTAGRCQRKAVLWSTGPPQGAWGGVRPSLPRARGIEPRDRAASCPAPFSRSAVPPGQRAPAAAGPCAGSSGRSRRPESARLTRPPSTEATGWSSTATITSPGRTPSRPLRCRVRHRSPPRPCRRRGRTSPPPPRSRSPAERPGTCAPRCRCRAAARRRRPPLRRGWRAQGDGTLCRRDVRHVHADDPPVAADQRTTPVAGGDRVLGLDQVDKRRRGSVCAGDGPVESRDDARRGGVPNPSGLPIAIASSPTCGSPSRMSRRRELMPVDVQLPPVCRTAGRSLPPPPWRCRSPRGRRPPAPRPVPPRGGS